MIVGLNFATKQIVATVTLDDFTFVAAVVLQKQCLLVLT